ncbi:MAG TPA: hypothetical protein ENI90_09495 [Methylothermaceae bacterium]|nr:hypothetical protein [Methylothermaceae bacterium]
MNTSRWSHEERLYRLLPALYRIRDLEQGEALRALLAIFEAELEAMERNIEDLYENHFIETCAPWAIPYIGDLLGVSPLHALEDTEVHNLRAYVANTLGYRRRKGTATVLEQLARDVTGWPARAVEFFQRLATTQQVNHVRLSSRATVDLREGNALELLNGPFETATHTVEVRRIETGRGRYNIPNVGLFLWRLQAYPLHRARAREIEGNWGFTFHPLGLDAPLFNRPRTETEITHLAEETHVPAPLRRRALREDLEQGGKRYFSDPSVLRVWRGEDEVSREELCIGDLSQWRRVTGKVVVDPELGRIAFPDEPEAVYVSYAYGFSADVGAGPYDRSEALAEYLSRPVSWQVGVTRDSEIGGDNIYRSLSEAVAAWNDQPPGTVGVVALLDSDRYDENLEGDLVIRIAESSLLVIIAAQWPADETGQRKPGVLVPRGVRPHIRGRISVRGEASSESADAGRLILDGILLEGELNVLIGDLGRLDLGHCTLVSTTEDRQCLRVNASSADSRKRNDRLEINLSRILAVGSVTLPDTVPKLGLEKSAVDHPGEAAVRAPGSQVAIGSTTVLGKLEAKWLEASNSLFTEPVSVERRQDGCVRFSYVLPGSVTPGRYRCQPDLALEEASDNADRQRIRNRLRPIFTATSHGHPGYLQLDERCAGEIRTGGQKDGEMGVFHFLYQSRRIANLETTLAEYLPFGLEAGIKFMT